MRLATDRAYIGRSPGRFHIAISTVRAPYWQITRQIYIVTSTGRGIIVADQDWQICITYFYC